MRGMTAVSFLNQWNEAKMSKLGNEINYCKIRLHLRNDSKMSQKWGIFGRESNLEGLKSRLPIGREPKIEASDWSKSEDFEIQAIGLSSGNPFHSTHFGIIWSHSWDEISFCRHWIHYGKTAVWQIPLHSKVIHHLLQSDSRWFVPPPEYPWTQRP